MRELANRFFSPARTFRPHAGVRIHKEDSRDHDYGSRRNHEAQPHHDWVKSVGNDVGRHRLVRKARNLI
jgi:hypothetical protein